MANLKSSKKDIKKIIKKTKYNRIIKSKLKTFYKKFKLLVNNNENPKEIDLSLRKYISIVDKASKKNIIHRNKANKIKSLFSNYILKNT